MRHSLTIALIVASFALATAALGCYVAKCNQYAQMQRDYGYQRDQVNSLIAGGTK